MDKEEYFIKIREQCDIYDSLLDLATSGCDISCWQCPFVVAPHGSTCVKKMVRDLLVMNRMSK